MIDDVRARLRLADGREVWCQVSVHYREVGSGRWVSAEEVGRLFQEELAEPSLRLGGSITNSDQIKQQIVEVQAQIALDAQGGAKSTSAARLVLKTLGEMDHRDQGEAQDSPWFILGRQLAEQILQLIEDEKGTKSEPGSQI